MLLHEAAPARPAYRDGNVLRWLGAYTTSVTGDIVYFLALSWAVTREGGPARAGLVLAVAAVPRALLMLAGGVAADRFGPRRIVIASDAVRCAAVLVLAAAVHLGAGTLWLLFAVALVFGAVDALFMPAVGALPPRLVAPGQLARVQGMRSLAVRVSNALGPPLAALVLAFGGPAGTFGTAGLLFLASLLLLAAMRTRAVPPTADEPRANAWQHLRDGLRHVRTHRALLPLVIVIGLSEMCFSGPVGAGLVLLTAERDWGPAALGGMLSAFSIGGAAAALAVTALPRVPRAGAVLGGSLAATAVLVTSVGLAPAPPLAIGAAAVIGLTSGTTAVLANALLQNATEPRFLGRVTAVTTLCTLGLSPLLYPAAGFVSAAWGSAAFFAGCGVVCLVATVVAVGVRGVRGAGLEPGGGPSEKARTASPQRSSHSGYAA